MHQVDSPAYDAEGRLYATLSGQRGQETPVSVFRIRADGAREPFVTGLGNATSLAVGPDGHLYVSSRFEGTVSRVSPDGEVEKFAEGLGVAFGLAFNHAGDLLVGDRSGTIHRVSRDGRHTALASIPPSVAAFHLAVAPDDTLVVSAPTLNSSDVLYRVSPDGEVTRWIEGFGRPQGLAFDAQGVLHVVDALAGDSVVYRIAGDGHRTAVVSGAGLLGIAFDPLDGTMTVCTDDTIYRILCEQDGRPDRAARRHHATATPTWGDVGVHALAGVLLATHVAGLAERCAPNAAARIAEARRLQSCAVRSPGRRHAEWHVSPSRYGLLRGSPAPPRSRSRRPSVDGQRHRDGRAPHAAVDSRRLGQPALPSGLALRS